MRLRVVCATGDTMATLCPTSAFSNVDLPAFGRPTMATNPDLKLMRRDDSSRVTASTHEDFRWDMQRAPLGAHAGHCHFSGRSRSGFFAGRRNQQPGPQPKDFSLVGVNNLKAHPSELHYLALNRHVTCDLVQ